MSFAFLIYLKHLLVYRLIIMASLASRRLFMLAPRRFATTASSYKKKNPDEGNPNLDRNAYRLPEHPQFMPAFNPEVDTASKTTVKILNDDDDNYLLVNGYSKAGFNLSNGVLALGPIALFPKSVFQWRITGHDSLTLDSFSLFYLLDPRIDILVIGLGDRGNQMPRDLLRGLMEKRKMSVEILPTEDAITTFNWLNSERRYVAGAFIPPKRVRITEDDIYQAAQMRAKEQFMPDEPERPKPSAPDSSKPTKLLR